MSPSRVLFLVVAFFAVAVSARAEVSSVIAEIRQDTNHGRWEQAQSKIRSQMAAAEKSGDLKAQAAVAVENARVQVESNFFLKRDPQGALKAIEAAQTVAERSGDQKSIAGATFLLGRYHYGEWLASGGSLEKPQQLISKALEMQRKVDDKNGIAYSLFFLGLIEQMEKRYDPALAYFEQSLALAESIGDVIMQSYDHRHIGFVKQVKGDLDGAYGHYKKSLEQRQQAGFMVGVPFAMTLLADFMAEHRNDSKQGIEMLKQAIAAAQKNNSPRGEFLAQMALGEAYMKANDMKQAESYTLAAIAGAERFGHQEAVDEGKAQLEKIRAGGK